MNLMIPIALAFALAFSAISGVHAAEICAPSPVAPRTLTAPAADYAVKGRHSLDADGILVFDYGVDYNNLGKYRNPYFISNYANALYRDWVQSDCNSDEYKQRFLKQAAYLRDSAVRQNGMARWEYSFPNDRWELAAGWISGIGQARIAAVLWRAWGITQDDTYRQVAKEGMEVYRHPLTEGGVITHDGAATWIEEYPDPAGHSYKVLNGHITALAGLQDFSDISGDGQWNDLVAQGILAVKNELPRFDAGFLSYYSLNQPGAHRILAARGGYNALHVEQLLWLYEQQPQPIFLHYASMFQNYELNQYAFSARSSVDPDGHGPGHANALYGSNYWSDNPFPTWIKIDMPQTRRVGGMWIESQSEKAVPRDFAIEARINGSWQTLKIVTDNDIRQRAVHWNPAVRADQLRLTIYSDNGNRNVALQAAMPILVEEVNAPITNYCNYRIRGSFHYNVNAAIDPDIEDGMRVFCPGWVILPNPTGRTRLSVTFEGKDNASMVVDYSVDLQHWIPLGEFNAASFEDVYIPDFQFIRIQFDTDVKRINKISLHDDPGS